MRFTDEGLLTVGVVAQQSWGPLLLLREGDADPITLAESVPVPNVSITTPWVGDRQAMTVTLDSQALEIDLTDGSATVLAEPAAVMRSSASGRFVLWQEGQASPDVTLLQTGPIHLLDRETGERRSLLEGDLLRNPNAFRDDFVVLFDPSYTWNTRVFSLPDGDEITLPEGAHFRGTAPDGRLWYGRGEDGRNVEEHLLDLTTGDDTIIYEGDGYTRGSAEAMRVFVPADSGGIQQGRLLEVDWNTGDTRLVAEGIHLQWSAWLDHRVLAIGDRQDDAYGTLRMYGPDHPGGIVLDDHVAIYSERLADRRPVGADILYMVLDPGRAGLWRHSLP